MLKIAEGSPGCHLYAWRPILLAIIWHLPPPPRTAQNPSKKPTALAFAGELQRVIEPASSITCSFCNLPLLQEGLRRLHTQRLEHQEALRREEELLAADYDEAAQRKIEALIHKRNIDENFKVVGCSHNQLPRELCCKSLTQHLHSS